MDMFRDNAQKPPLVLILEAFSFEFTNSTFFKASIFFYLFLTRVMVHSNSTGSKLFLLNPI